MSKLLFYTADAQKSAAILRLCGKLKLSYVRIGTMDFPCTIASILSGNPQPPRNRSAKIPLFASYPELLIFSGFTDQQLDSFLKEYRKSGITSIALKAVVTPSNFLWTVYELTGELAKEHAVLG